MTYNTDERLQGYLDAINNKPMIDNPTFSYVSGYHTGNYVRRNYYKRTSNNV